MGGRKPGKRACAGPGAGSPAERHGAPRHHVQRNGLPGEPGKFRADDAPLLFPAKEAGQPPAFLISSLPPAKPRRKERKSRRTCSIPFLFLAGFLSASLPLSGTFTGKNRVALTGGFTKIFSRLPFPSGPFFLRGGIKPSGHKKPGLASRRAGPAKIAIFPITGWRTSRSWRPCRYGRAGSEAWHGGLCLGSRLQSWRCGGGAGGTRAPRLHRRKSCGP